ncbi:MAG TPA: hypothetical protein ENH82_18505 [bacterium]|nr:hypothetical protein [bacterium]
MKTYNEEEWVILTDGDLAKIVRVKKEDVENKYISSYLVEYPKSEKHPSGEPQWKFYHSIDRLAESSDFKKHIIDAFNTEWEY